MPTETSSNSASTPPSGLLANRNFVLLWFAYGISALGDHVSELALLKTQNALSREVDTTPLAARMTFLFFVPFFLLGPFTGYLADRLPRRGLMVAADLIRCVIMLLFVYLMVFTSSWGALGPFLPLVLVGVFAAVFAPAREAMLPSLIARDQLVRANGLMAGLGIIAAMIAAVISGYLADHYSPKVSFRFDAATFFASAMLLTFLRPPRLHAMGAEHGSLGAAVGDVVDGFRYVRQHRRAIELLAIAGLFWFCGSLVRCAMPAIVRDVYEGSYRHIGTFQAFLGVGFILGAIIVGILGDALRSEIAITWGLFGISVAILLFALSVFLPLSPGSLYAVGAVGVTGAGIFGLGVMASFNALLQRIVPDRYRGRVFGIKNLVTIGAVLAATGGLGLPQWQRVDRWVGFILVGVAVLTAAAAMITLNVRLSRSPQSKGITLAQHFNEFFAKFWWRLQRIGRSTIPREGAVIVTANHVTSADPFILHAAAPYRQISFMVASEYMEKPLLGPIFALNDCIPVRRTGQDTAGMKKAMRLLRDGKAVGIFIEGRIMLPGETPEPKDGVAMLALKTGTPVIPAHISGVVHTNEVVKGLIARHRVRVRFGRPVDLSGLSGRGREHVRVATRRIYDAIVSLAPKEDGEVEGSP
jgi:1-acyl-sn-glycerol-3-phosphate acyltransferase